MQAFASPQSYRPGWRDGEDHGRQKQSHEEEQGRQTATIQQRPRNTPGQLGEREFDSCARIFAVRWVRAPSPRWTLQQGFRMPLVVT